MKYRYRIECMNEQDEWSGINGGLEQLLNDFDGDKIEVPQGSELYTYYFVQLPNQKLYLDEYKIMDVQKCYIYRVHHYEKRQTELVLDEE